MPIFFLKIKFFAIIFLSLIFTGEEIAKGSTTTTFKKYAKFYYNFQYHTYFSFPRRGMDCFETFLKERTGNFDFFMNLRIQSGHPYERLLAYFVLFFVCTYKSFSHGKKARGFFFLITSISNVLSAVFIPQYVFLIGKYGPYKNLLRLNFETGFYLSGVPGLNGIVLRSYVDQNVEDKRISFGDNCPICIEILEEKDKDNITALKCKGIKPKAKYHCFHTECIARWLETNNTCPVCKDHVEIEDYSTNRTSNYINDSAKDDSMMRSFFAERNFFSVMLYVDTTLCVDNLDDVLKKKNTLYWSVEFIFLRLGAQLESSSFSYRVHPFIGFCGISIRFLNVFAFSLVPTYMIIDTSSIYPGKILLDIQLSFTWGRLSFK